MDAKELTKKAHELDNQFAELRGRIHELETQNLILTQKVKDLSYLESYTHQLDERLKFLERK